MLTLARRSSTVLALLLLWPAASTAQIDYRLAMDLDAREWSVEGRLANPGGEDFSFWLPRWTAGAYHLADFGRFVDGLQAFGAEGNELSVERASDSEFRIAAAGSDEVVVRYTARSISTATFSEGVIDVESNRIADGYAYVTPVSLFGFVPERVDQPVSLAVELPEGWEAATALDRDAEAGVYRAPDYYRFEDSPLFFAPGLLRFESEAGGRPLAVTVFGRDETTAAEVAEGCARVVEAAAELMQGLPYDRYHFLIAFVPESQGGASGLEHSFSTLILVDENTPIESTWGVIAHEFFHLWCAERIHVEEIHVPDYTQPLETGTIWVNEGVTEYFTRHILLHAGLTDREEFLDGLAGGAVPRFGPKNLSWTDVSRAAVDWTGGQQDIMVFAVRMYMQGPRTIFALDLEMRRASDGERGVLDLLHRLVDDYVEEDRGFPEDGMPDIIDEVAGADLSSFYERFIDGSEFPDLAEYLDVIGYELQDGEVHEVADPTPAQVRARADFFSATGVPAE